MRPRPAARLRLISRAEAAWPLVRRIAQQMLRTSRYPAHVELDDLVSAGCIGLMQADGTFDDQRGASFRTHAGHRIRGAILDYLRDCDPLGRVGRQRARDGSVPFFQVQLEYLDDLQLVAPAADVLAPFVECEVARAIRALPPREAYVIRQHFFEDRLLRDIAMDLGVNHSRASQLKLRALERLREGATRGELSS